MREEKQREKSNEMEMCKRRGMREREEDAL